MKRVISSVQIRLGLQEQTDEVRAVAVAADAAGTWVSAQEHIAFEAGQHFHEGNELLRLVQDRLPTNVLHARSRRPGRRA